MSRPPLETNARPRLVGARILVVDDHEDLAENLREILEVEGAQVTCAATASAAIDAVGRDEGACFDVALVDIQLPDATGHDLLPQLRRAREGLTEVVLVTGNASIDDAIEAVGGEANAYILKPFDVRELIAIVNRALEKVRLRRRSRDLENRARIAEKLAAVGTLAAGLAHEIRNPLNGASLQLQLLQRRLLRENIDLKIGDPITVVLAEISRLSNLVTDFLNFARPAELMREPLDLHQLANRVVALELEETRHLGLDLVVQGHGQPVTINGDAQRLQQVVLNLVRNAMESLSEVADPTTFRSNMIVVECGQQQDGCFLAVIDQGPGIPAQQLPRIFEPFFSTKASGTGLGMSICHSVIDQHGGEIRINSKPGCTRIELFFPKG